MPGKIKVPPFTALVCNTQSFNTQNNPFYSVTLLNSPYSKNNLFIRICALEDFFAISDPIFRENSSNDIFVDDTIISFMQNDFGARVVLRKITTVPSVKEIEVHSKKSYLVNVVEKLKIYLADHCKPPLIYNANFPLKIDEHLYCSLKFLPNSDKFCVIGEGFLRNCSYSLCDEPVKPLENNVKKCEAKKFCMITTAKDACDNILSVLFKMSTYHSENIILCGKLIITNHESTEYISLSFF